MAEQIVLDVVEDFPGGRVRAGDVFYVDPSYPDRPLVELRYHGPAMLEELGRQLHLMSCRSLACHRCPLSGSCPLRPRAAGRRRWVQLVD